MYRQLRESLDTEQRHLFLAAGSLPDPTTPPPGLIPPLTGTFLTTWNVWPQMSRGFVCGLIIVRGHAPCHMSVFIPFSIFSPSIHPLDVESEADSHYSPLLESSHRCEWVSAEKLKGYHLAGLQLHAFHSNWFLHTYGLNQWFSVSSVMILLKREQPLFAPNIFTFRNQPTVLLPNVYLLNKGELFGRWLFLKKQIRFYWEKKLHLSASFSVTYW